ncbi:MAG: hypothetical protein Q7T61_00975 [Caulobacter sp.]|nr:hypothetical protein [Caulobacter sp.]
MKRAMYASASALPILHGLKRLTTRRADPFPYGTYTIQYNGDTDVWMIA